MRAKRAPVFAVSLLVGLMAVLAPIATGQDESDIPRRPIEDSAFGGLDRAGLVESSTNADVKLTDRLAAEGAYLRRSLTLAGDEGAAVVLDAMLDEEG